MFFLSVQSPSKQPVINALPQIPRSRFICITVLIVISALFIAIYIPNGEQLMTVPVCVHAHCPLMVATVAHCPLVVASVAHCPLVIATVAC